MRTIVLVILTVLVVAGGFVGYQWMQTPLAYQGGKKPPTQTAASMPGDEVRVGSLGSGKGVWVASDRNTGLPISRFRAADFQPQVDGRVKVDHPQAEFYLGADRSRIVSIEGQTGWVALHGEGPKIRQDMTGASPMQMPTRGDLFDVKIRYYLSQKQMDADDADVTLNLHHMSFDVETFRIASEAFTDEQGRRVEADDVPIQVRGKDYDFDGRGLQLRWDEFDHRLQSLRVAKGERLTIKHPKDFRNPSEQGTGAKAAGSRAVGEPMAVVGKRGAAPAVRAARQTSSDVYRATFHDGVKVTQADKITHADEQLAQGAAMNLDFMSTEAKEPQEKGAGEKGEGQKGSTTQAITATTEAGAIGPVATSSPAAASAPEEAAQENAPIIVTWTGEFTINPAPPAAIFPRTKNDAVIELVGPDAVITVNDNPLAPDRKLRLAADHMLYHVGPKVAYARGTEKSPVKFTDGHGTTVISESFEYSFGNAARNIPAWAMLSGKSSAILPANPEAKTEAMQVNWSKLGTLHFAPNGQIETLEMTGAVSIEHPQIRRFKAEKLLLEFDPNMASTGADPGTLTDKTLKTLRKISAQGDVDCLLANTDREQKPVAIQCQAMKLDTRIGANGKLEPTRVEAHGKVVAGDGKQMIQAENLVASLVPGTTAGSGGKIAFAGLKDLAADGDVSVTWTDGGKDGKLEAQKLNATDVQNRKPKLVRIEGKEGGVATVSQAGQTLMGHVIDVNMPDQYAHVIGAGSMRLAEAPKPGHPATSVQIVWNKDAVVDGRTNLASFDGKVAVTYLASDGSINNAWGERADIRLGTRAAAGLKPTKKGEINFLTDRFPQHLELTSASEKEDIQVQSVLPADDGTLIRQINLLGPKLICDFSEVDQKGVTVQGITVTAGKDRPGRMLYVDLPSTARKVVAVKPGLESKALPGATAFSWKDKLVYERSHETLSMLGDVVIRHEPKDRATESFDMSAQRVAVQLVEQGDVGGRVPAPSKSSPDFWMPTLVPKRMVAEGTPLRFTRQDLEFTAPLVEFDPITHLAIAHSADRIPVHVEKGTSPGEFREVQINTETMMVKMLDGGVTGRK